MLCISRFPGESFFIGPDIHVVVIRVDDDKVRLGIEAPRKLRISRDHPPTEKVLDIHDPNQ